MDMGALSSPLSFLRKRGGNELHRHPLYVTAGERTPLSGADGVVGQPELQVAVMVLLTHLVRQLRHHLRPSSRGFELQPTPHAPWGIL